MTKIRTRIAPSPTGPLHIGTARAALFNFIFSKKNKGKFILRIEDTDLERSDPIFEKDIKNGLEWLNIKWDEFYRQTDRLDSYEKYLKKLLKSGDIFWCPHSLRELALERQEQFLKKESPRHICSFRDGSDKNEDNKSILRFKNDFEKEIVFNDLVRGTIKIEARIFGDFSVAKNLRTPLYNFAVVVDDHEMEISHVIRGEDHISNTPKQIILQSSLGFKSPKYAHLPLILGVDRSKLSKRQNAVSVMEYKKSGYLPEAMLNFMFLLGWRPDSKEINIGEAENEIATINQVIKEFSLDRIQKGGAVFDIEKLKWMNREYIKKLKTKDLTRRLLEFMPPNLLKEINDDLKKWTKIAELLKERMTTLNEAGDMSEYFYKEPNYSQELLFPSLAGENDTEQKKQKITENILRHLRHIHTIVNKNASLLTVKGLEALLMPYAEKEGKSMVLWPFRASLSGRKASAGPFAIAEIIGKEETIKRLEKAIKMLE